MNLEDEQVELDGNKYYRIICLLSEKKDAGKCLAQIRVTRKDTGEFINAGFTVFDHGKKTVLESAIKKTSDLLLPELEKMGKPPDWDSEVRYILQLCKKLHSEIVKFGSYSIDILSLGNSVDKYGVEYSVFWKKFIKQSVVLGGKIEALGEKGRINLLELSEDAIKDPSDAWSLEEIDSRIMAFEFFMNPTEREKQVYDMQKKKLADRFSELGWD